MELAQFIKTKGVIFEAKKRKEGKERKG